LREKYCTEPLFKRKGRREEREERKKEKRKRLID